MTGGTIASQTDPDGVIRLGQFPDFLKMVSPELLQNLAFETMIPYRILSENLQDVHFEKLLGSIRQALSQEENAEERKMIIAQKGRK